MLLERKGTVRNERGVKGGVRPFRGHGRSTSCSLNFHLPPTFSTEWFQFYSYRADIGSSVFCIIMDAAQLKKNSHSEFRGLVTLSFTNKMSIIMRNVRSLQQKCRFVSTKTNPSPAPIKVKSSHARWYADMVPGMIPVALLGSAVFMVREVIFVRQECCNSERGYRVSSWFNLHLHTSYISKKPKLVLHSWSRK